MIKYRLRCSKDHEFEAWFSDSGTYDAQAKRGLVTCPACGSKKVSKALMAPSVSTSKRRERAARQGVQQAMRQAAADAAAESAPAASAAAVPASPADEKLAALRQDMLTAMRKVRAHVEANAENVGPRFAEEARRMHNDETETRGIYGEASLEEARELAEEGIDVLPLPRLPEDAN